MKTCLKISILCDLYTIQLFQEARGQMLLMLDDNGLEGGKMMNSIFTKGISINAK